jgi:hypothetical protein
MATVTTTLVSGQNAFVGSISSRGQYDVTVNSGSAGADFNASNSYTWSSTQTFSNNITINGLLTITGNTTAAQVNATSLNVGANVVVTTSGISVGNSSVNLSIASTTVGGNASFTIGNTTINGTLTATGNVTGNTAGFAIGYRDVPQNFTNTSFTLALTDAGKHILTQNTGSSTQTITIANNTSVAFQTGAAITIVVQSTGTVAVANGAGVTMYLTGNSTAKSTVTLNSYSMATLLKIGTDTWIVSGTGAT